MTKLSVDITEESKNYGNLRYTTMFDIIIYRNDRRHIFIQFYKIEDLPTAIPQFSWYLLSLDQWWTSIHSKWIYMILGIVILWTNISLVISEVFCRKKTGILLISIYTPGMVGSFHWIYNILRRLWDISFSHNRPQFHNHSWLLRTP